MAALLITSIRISWHSNLSSSNSLTANSKNIVENKWQKAIYVIADIKIPGFTV